MVELSEISLYYPRLPGALDGLSLVFFSDLHCRNHGRKERKLHDFLRSRPAEMLLCAGDLCFQFCLGNPLVPHDSRYRSLGFGFTGAGIFFRPRVSRTVSVLRLISSDVNFPLGSYVVRGNHDSDDLMAAIDELGFTVLSNQSRQLPTLAGGRFNLVGIDGKQHGAMDIPGALLGTDPVLFTIGLCHYPDTAEALTAGGVDLVLAGHTHGGQICLPSGRAVRSHINTANRYARGLTRLGGGYLYTTRGVGCSLVPVRIFCPPEVALIRLHRGDPADSSIRTRGL